MAPKSFGKQDKPENAVSTVVNASQVKVPSDSTMVAALPNNFVEQKSTNDELESGHQYLETIKTMEFPHGEEVSRSKLPDGRERIEYSGEQGNSVFNVISTNGNLIAESIVTPNGESLNRMYYETGNLREVSYLPRSDHAFSVMYTEDGTIRERRDKINGRTFQTIDGIRKELHAQGRSGAGDKIQKSHM